MSGISSIILFFAFIGAVVCMSGIGIIALSVSQGRPARASLVGLTILGGILAVTLWIVSTGILVVKPGEAAVVYQTLSGDLEDNPRQAGTHIIMPILYNFHVYDVTQQEYTMSSVRGEGAQVEDDSISARTSDGQNVQMDVTVIFNVDPNQANILYPRWRDNYLNGLIRPTIRTVIRNAVSESTAETLYSEGRITMQISAEEEARVIFEEEGLQLSRLLVRTIDFSDEFSAAIEAKQSEEQRRQRAEIEAARLIIEAGGRRDAAIAEANGEAEAIRIRAEAQAAALDFISQQISANPLLIQYEYVQNLSDNVELVLLPANSPFLFDFESLGLSLEDMAPSVTPTTEESSTDDN